jgi:hypothetical protein
MARRDLQHAEYLRLSANMDAVIYGPGKVLLVQGRNTPTHLNEREAKKLVEEWAGFQERRRAVTPSPAPEVPG